MKPAPFTGLLLHDKNRQQLATFLQKPAQGVLVSGPAGSGKRTVARRLAAALLAVSAENLNDHPYFRRLGRPKDKQEISIDEVRRLTGFMNLKIPGRPAAKTHRLILIEDAESLSHEAQNALLKMLEEPPLATTFILTAPASHDLLPTVASRLQQISIVPASLQLARDFYQSSYTPAAIDSAWRLSAGASGLLSALLVKDADHPLKQAVTTAKEALSSNAYQRLLLFNRLAADKVEFGLVLDALNRSLSALQQSAVNQQNQSKSRRILASRRLVAQAADALSQNISPRLVALQLALNLSI